MPGVFVKEEERMGRYFAVAKGHKPGVYDDWAEANKQADMLTAGTLMRFDDLRSAIECLRASGLHEDEIRLFRKTFRSTLR